MQSLVSFCEQTYWYMEKHSNREIKKWEWQLEYSVHLINWSANKEDAKYPFIQFFLGGPEKKANWMWCFFAPHSGVDVIIQLRLKNFFFNLLQFSVKPKMKLPDTPLSAWILRGETEVASALNSFMAFPRELVFAGGGGKGITLFYQYLHYHLP